MSINSFRHLGLSLDKFYPIDNNPDDSIVISSANRFTLQVLCAFVKPESNLIDNHQAVTAISPTPVEKTP